MKRQLIVWIALLALGLQGSMLAWAAGAPSMAADCETSAGAPVDTSHEPCCPTRAHTMSCCLDACLAVAALPMTPSSLTWHGQSAPLPQRRTTSFSSRGDSPLIRPPIL